MIDGEILTIGPGDLVPHVLQIKHDGYRLIQICATTTKEGYELTYSFGRGYEICLLYTSVHHLGQTQRSHRTHCGIG